MQGQEIYNNFMSQPWENDNFKYHTKIDSKCLLECYIHEPNKDNNLMNVIKNMSFMIPYCGLKIQCSSNNYEYLVDKINPQNNNVVIDPSVPTSRTLYEYNNNMVNPEFWKSFESEKVLIFQTDSAVLQNNILKFLHYDYLGARWPYNPLNIDDIHVGNGGFNLRNPKICYDISRMNVIEKDMAEDVYYAKHFYYTEYANVPDIHVADQFSTEVVPVINTFGMHKTYAYNTPYFIKKLLDVHYKKYPQPMILDVFIGCDDKIVHRSQKLFDWVKLGMGPTGINIPKDAVVPYDIPNKEQFCGKKKYLLIKYISSLDRKEYFCPVMLVKNKIVQYDNLIN